MLWELENDRYTTEEEAEASKVTVLCFSDIHLDDVSKVDMLLLPG